MKRKGVFKRGLAFTLSIVCAMSLFTGCGKKDKASEDSILNEAQKGSKDYVFDSEEIPLDGVDASKLNRIRLVGDRVYTNDYGIDGYMTIYSFNIDGSDLKTTRIPVSSKESYGYIDYDKDGNVYAILDVYNWMEDEEDALILPDEEGEANADSSSADTSNADASSTENSSIEDSSTEASSAEVMSDAASSEASDENLPAEDITVTEDSLDSDSEGMHYYEEMSSEEEEMYVVKYDAEGNLIFKHDLLADVSEDDYLSAYGILYTDENGLLVSTSKGVGILDESSGNLKMIINNDQAAYQLYRGFEGDIFTTYYGESNIEVATLNPSSGELTSYSEPFANKYGLSFFEGNGYDIYFSSQNGIFGFDKKTSSIVKLLDYVDSDLQVDYSIDQVAAISDTEMIALLPDENYDYHLTRLTKVPADQVKDRQIITLGGDYIDYTVRQAAVKFNQENEAYKIKLVDYSSYNTEENWSAGTERFNMDIVSGNVPDIMAFDMDAPVDSYINKGVFLDLSGRFNEDPDLSNADFIDNVMDAFKTGDKMYQIVPSFYVATLLTKSKFVNGKESFTVKDMQNLISEKGVSYDYAFGVQTRSDLLQYMIAASGDKYIDWENKKCDFNGEDFVSLLEFVNNFPEEVKEEVWSEDTESYYREDKSLFRISMLMGFEDYRRERYGVMGDDIEFVGFPSATGKNISVIYPSVRLAISSQSKNADGAWEFVKSFLSEEYQDGIEYVFPVRQSSFDKMAQKAIEPQYYEDEDGNMIEEESIYWIAGAEVKLPRLIQADVKYVESFINSLDQVLSYNESAYNIIMEEASAYFSGQKSAQEVADIIQSRLTIYVNENS